MAELLISDFKARCIEVVNAVHAGGTGVVITRRGRPLVKVVPLSDPPAVGRRLGTLAGEAEERGDIVHADLAGDWETAG